MHDIHFTRRQDMTVWVLTSGEYSDRSIAGVCSTEEKALAVAEDGGYDVEAYELDWLVGCRDGKVYRANIWLESGDIEGSEAPCLNDSSRHPEKCRVEFLPQRWHPDGTHKPRIDVFSPISFEHAAKVAVEKRQEWLRTREAVSS